MRLRTTHYREGFSTTSLGQKGTATLRGHAPWGIVLASEDPSASPVRLSGAPEGGCLPGFLAKQKAPNCLENWFWQNVAKG